MASVRINFSKASDTRTPPSQLLYKVYTSKGADIDTLDGIDANGVLRAEALDANTFLLTGLEANELIYFNITVEDLAKRRSRYSMGFLITQSDQVDTLDIIDEPFFMLSGTSRQILFIYEYGDIGNTVLNWVSSDPLVATVDSSGVITGVSTGTAVITATSDYDPLFTDQVTVGVDLFDFGPFSDDEFTTEII